MTTIDLDIYLFIDMLNVAIEIQFVIHDRNTRQHQGFHLPKYYMCVLKISVRYQGVSIWNNLNESLKRSISLNAFKGFKWALLIQACIFVRSDKFVYLQFAKQEHLKLTLKIYIQLPLPQDTHIKQNSVEVQFTTSLYSNPLIAKPGLY